MSKKEILIVEDEEKLSRVLELELTYEGYDVRTTGDGKQALQFIREKSWDLVLLDIMLPEISGLDVLRECRKTDKQTPIILLTARSHVHDKVRGLDFGANDYVTKPFDIEELLARIRSQLRQNRTVAQEEQQLLHVGALQIDEKRREVTHNQEVIDLTRREFDLLTFLVRNKNMVLTREQVMEHVWGFDYIGDTNVVDVYVRYLRQKIDKKYSVSYIQTIRGVGYMIEDIKP